jgi:hypothetical protein
MRLAEQDVRAMAREQRLLREVVMLARRCDGSLPRSRSDAQLAGTGRCGPVMPSSVRAVHPDASRFQRWETSSLTAGLRPRQPVAARCGRRPAGTAQGPAADASSRMSLVPPSGPAAR